VFTTMKSSSMGGLVGKTSTLLDAVDAEVSGAGGISDVDKAFLFWATVGLVVGFCASVKIFH